MAYARSATNVVTDVTVTWRNCRAPGGVISTFCIDQTFVYGVIWLK